MNSKKNKAAALAVLLAGILMTVETPLCALAKVPASTYEDYREGIENEKAKSGKEASYTVISIETEEDLVKLAENCSVDAWSADKLVQLKADITLQEKRDICIPSFGGIFEGNGHRISNLYIARQGSSVGLFRYLQKGGRVRSLSVEGKVLPEGTQSQTGGIVGINYGVIYGCSFSGQVMGETEVGGIAGVNGKSGEIRQCEASASVIGSHSVGGICGNNHGILNNCTNKGGINTHTTEMTYNLEDITMENLEDINSSTNVAAHTDSGGIAGISDGKIYYCTNSGTVGYQHVGYNTGGIVGRLHQGYLQNCTNTGHILGRKDVGGIAGQMEPFLEVQYLNGKLKELDRETDLFLNLMEAAHTEFNSYGSQASRVSKSLIGNLRSISDTSKNLTGTVNELWYIYNQELTAIGEDLRILGSDMSVSDGNVRSENASGKNGDNDWILSDRNDLESYQAALKKFGDSAGGHLNNITTVTVDRTGGIGENLKNLNHSMEAAGGNLDLLADILQEGTEKTGNNVEALIEQARVLRNLLNEIRDDLFRYEGITIEDASDEKASTGLSNPGAEMNAGDAGADGGGEETVSGQRIIYDTDSFQQGKITRCLNKGLVEADANVGGIAGQIATEYDFDPEGDITYTGAESFDIERTVKAVVRDSRNLGEIIAKKDCAGGIVGKADFGAVISCESYAPISSTGGSSVGGIAGSSGYAIRNCYSMGEVSGRNYVGGIAGKGCDIFYSCAYNTLEPAGERHGAIAGMVEDNGTLYRNYYVPDNVGGIDGIGYEGGAEPLAYEEFCRLEGLPENFSSFTITFMADGVELGSCKCGYGDAVSREQIPMIPEKEGFYGFWPEYDFDSVTGSRVLEAQYERWITALESEETDEKGRPKVLAEGEFFPGARLTMKQAGEEFAFVIENEEAIGMKGITAQPYDGPVQVRVLCEEPEKDKVETLGDNGYREASSRVIGSYLVFSLENCPAGEMQTFRVTTVQKDSMIKWYVIAAAAAFLIAILLWRKFVRRIAARKALEKAAGEQNGK